MEDLDLHPQAPSSTASPPLASPAIADAIEKLLAHPELLATIASTVGLGKGAPTGSPPESPSVPAEAPLPVAAPAPTGDLGDAVAALAPLLGALSGKGGSPKSDDPRACLLHALKPYVSHGRAEAIDTIIQLSRVSEVLKKLS